MLFRCFTRYCLAAKCFFFLFGGFWASQAMTYLEIPFFSKMNVQTSNISVRRVKWASGIAHPIKSWKRSPWWLYRPLVIIILMPMLQARRSATGTSFHGNCSSQSHCPWAFLNSWTLEEQLVLLEIHTFQSSCREQCHFHLNWSPSTIYLSKIRYEALHIQLTGKAESHV